MLQTVNGIGCRDRNGITSFGSPTGGKCRRLGNGGGSADHEEQEAPKPDLPTAGISGRAVHFIGIYRKRGWM
jgi:hypothetical protein